MEQSRRQLREDRVLRGTTSTRPGCPDQHGPGNPLSAAGLAFEGITFRYARRAPWVLRDFSWAVPPGRTVLLGPNGAGKTTLLSIGADALRPDGGRVLLDGREPRASGRAAYRRAVGWMPQQVRAVPGLTAREQVAYCGWLKGESSASAWRSALRALDQVGLRDLANHRASSLSGGQLRRVGLAQALVHASAVLLLDEPTVGLDPAQRVRFREILADLPHSVPVVASTHQVDDLSELFERVVVMDAGTFVFEGNAEEFLSLASPDHPHRAEAAYASLVGHER